LDRTQADPAAPVLQEEVDIGHGLTFAINSRIRIFFTSLNVAALNKP